MVDSPFEQLSVDALRRRTSLKWRTYPPDVLPLWVAEMDVLPAEPVAAVLRQALELGDTGYPSGARAYAEALAGFARRRWGWDGVDVDSAQIVPDVMLGIVEVLKLVTEPGSSVVVNTPVYPPFFAFTEHADRRVVGAPLGTDGRIDVAALEAAFRDTAPAAFLLANPHNPTGAVHTVDELVAVAALAREYGVRVIVDEIHAPLVLPGATFTPYLSVDGTEDAFVVTSASKAWNLPGVKAALAIAGTAGADDLRRMPEEVSHGPSHFGVLAHTAAYTDGEPWLNALLAALAANRELVGRLLAEHLPTVGYTPPDGTYLAWLDCRPLGFGDDATPGAVADVAGPARAFLDQSRVALSSGHAFGPGGGGHVRLNFATSQAILTEAVTRMGRVLP
ncbi:MalY/PatB family protein [Gordonia liuliyuniae]|uniref:cysteine-S-conjugate beta-lyase n=1 Tax=Gordonia liuliyuniae TaxID=2911517 RepID=A0ABS9IY37_9ACTN|nr:aminotransferase class I/II-fold pyridoxal phosphate-dependent enzyme [Gordonia liuliyuniae]MCF8590495.1 aminotransferase class I/II-fold pyridoxal phosphate-dependent enzyme [Gordonia liuliyuniae]